MLRFSMILAVTAVATAISSDATARGEGTIRLRPGACSDMVRGTVVASPLGDSRPLFGQPPAGAQLFGRCTVVGDGATRSFVILWSMMNGPGVLQPRTLEGVPFGTTVIPARCDGPACEPALPEDEVRFEMREAPPRLIEGGSMI